MTTLRANETMPQTLKGVSPLTGLPMHAVLDKAVSVYQRILFLEKLNEESAALRADPQAWQEEQEERALWEQSISDDLPREERVRSENE